MGVQRGLSVLLAVLVVCGLLVVAPSSASAAPEAPVTQAAPAPDQRSAINFNREWLFARSDVSGAQARTFDDSGWAPIALPHSFDAPYHVGGSSGGSSFYVGVGWYRKHFTVGPEWAGKTLELDFEGSFQITDVWVNGTHLTTHRGGFTGFAVDISSAVVPGANTLAIKVDNSWHKDLAPRAGDHQFTGGIYRDVSLVVSNPTHVTWYGTFVSTPALTNPDFDTSDPAYYRNIDLAQYPSQAALEANLVARRSNVRVQTEVSNDAAVARDVVVRHTVKDPNGTVISTFTSSPKTLQPKQVATIDAVSGATNDTGAMLSGLRLWSITDPALYTVTTDVLVDESIDGQVVSGVTVDSFGSTFGFRSAQYRKDGFYLNGVKTLLVGADAHQDQAGWGNAVPDGAQRRDVEMIRQAGMNFIRGSHYPHDPAYADATDQLGVMFWSEGVFWGIGGQNGQDGDPEGLPSDWLADAYPQNPANEAGFEASVKDALTAMIRVNRNHPSIINWSMGNEVFFTASGTMDKAKALVSALRDQAHALDPTRKAGMGGVQRNGFDQLSVSDIAGYNGDGADFTNTWMSNMVAEYGSYTSDRPGSYAPHYDHTADPNDPNTFSLTTNSAGLALWAGFDHGSVGGAGLARMGMVDYSRLPKGQWYWYRENKARWTSLTTVPDPTPHAADRSTAGTATSLTLATGTSSSTRITNDGKSDTQLVATFTNGSGTWVSDTREVTLTVTSGPGVFAGGKSITLTPGLSAFDGRAAATFRSYYAGTSVITASAPGLPNATISITTSDVVGAAGQTEPPGFWDSSTWGNGSTPLAEPTAYGTVNKALLRPMTATSAASGAAPGLAADGNPGTAWSAATAGPGQSISNFLEVTQFVYKVQVVQPSGTNLPFTLEVQNEAGQWSTVASYTAATVGQRPAEETLPGNQVTNVRVSFPALTTSQTARLAELVVFSNDAAQTPQYTGDGAYVSDLIDYSTVTTAWGTAAKDKSASGGSIIVGAVTYAKGVGLHAASSALVPLGGRYARLVGVIGFDGGQTGPGDATWQVYADDTLIYTAALAGAQTAPLDISVNGVQTLRLVTDANGVESNDHTDWADLRVVGAPRDLTNPGSAVRASFAPMRQYLEPSSTFRGLVEVRNAAQQSVTLTAEATLLDAAGGVLKTARQPITLASNASGRADLQLALGTDVADQRVVVLLRDASGAAVSGTAQVFPAVGGASSGVTWRTPVDGDSAELTKTGTWASYPAATAYQGTETYTEVAGSVMSGSFSGTRMRIAAKFDGSQVGFRVAVDGKDVGTVSTTASDGSNTYQVAWTSGTLAAGAHTFSITSTGKAGIDYVQYGDG